MASLVDLSGFAEDLLDAFASELTALGVEVPEQRYVAPGALVPWDGESLTVILQSIDQGQPGAAFGGTYQPGRVTVLWATFAVALVREVPILNGEGNVEMMIPPTSDLDEAGQVGINDASALVRSAIAVHENSGLIGLGEGFSIGALTPLGPMGGIAGHRLLLSLSLS